MVTRPLGASFADYFGRARSLSGLGFGSGRVAVVVAILVAIGVGYLAVTRRDIQRPQEYAASPEASSQMAPERPPYRG